MVTITPSNSNPGQGGHFGSEQVTMFRRNAQRVQNNQ
jgi:hypothetical protein